MQRLPSVKPEPTDYRRGSQRVATHINALASFFGKKSKNVLVFIPKKHVFSNDLPVVQAHVLVHLDLGQN